MAKLRVVTGAEGPGGEGPGPETTLSLDELRSQLERLVDRVCPSWLASSRDDLVQTALIRVAQVVERSEGNATFAASYLWRVAYSVTVDEIRQLRRRQETSLEEASAAGVPDEAPRDPEARMVGRQIGTAIRECIRRLGPHRRAAVTLYLLGHSVPEVGRLLGWPSKRVENLVYRGVADLRRCLADKGYQP
jgi:RNA polymerase sigma-70 factor (ECF subfamily)